MYKQGDTVWHRQYGIGVLRSIETPENAPAPPVFATLHIPRQGLDLAVPKTTFDRRIRPLMTETEAGEVLSYIASLRELAEPVWRKRQRDNQERLGSGDPLEICAVAKGLIRLRSQGVLGAGDKAQLKHSLQLLADELSFVLGGEQEQMVSRLEQACLTSLNAA